MEKKQVATKGAAKVRRSRLPWAIPFAALLLVIIFLASGTGDTLSRDMFLTPLQWLRAIPAQLNSVYASFTRDEPAAVSGTVEEPETEPQFSAAAVDTPVPETASTAAPTPTVLATAEPTQSPPTPAATEGASPDVRATIVAAARVQSFDLTTFLNEQERSDLAAFAIQATWAQGAPPGELVLLGTVTMTSVQNELLELAAEI